MRKVRKGRKEKQTGTPLFPLRTLRLCVKPCVCPAIVSYVQRPGGEGEVETSCPEGARQLKPTATIGIEGEHHRVVKLQEQRKFLKAYGVDRDERYAWD